MHTPVISGACEKLTMVEATRPGLLWLLLFPPTDMAVPSILYGSIRGSRRLYADDVVMSFSGDCFSRRQCSNLSGEFLDQGRLLAHSECSLRLSSYTSISGRDQARRRLRGRITPQAFVVAYTPDARRVRNNLFLHNIVTDLSLHEGHEPS